MARIDFRGKKILITGASSGIGKALAAEFAKKGAHLALGALPAEKILFKPCMAPQRPGFRAFPRR